MSVITSPDQHPVVWGDSYSIHTHVEYFDSAIGVLLTGIVVPYPQGVKGGGGGEGEGEGGGSRDREGTSPHGTL